MNSAFQFAFVVSSGSLEVSHMALNYFQKCGSDVLFAAVPFLFGIKTEIMPTITTTTTAHFVKNRELQVKVDFHCSTFYVYARGSHIASSHIYVRKASSIHVCTHIKLTQQSGNPPLGIYLPANS